MRRLVLTRIGSTAADTIWDVAFRNPDGSIVLLAVNDDWGMGTERFNMRLGGRRSRRICRPALWRRSRSRAGST
jgi:hypothetical protein